jgi:hypothetical protein
MNHSEEDDRSPLDVALNITTTIALAVMVWVIFVSKTEDPSEGFVIFWMSTCGAPVFFISGVRAHLAGKIDCRGVEICEDKNPVTFWIAVITNWLMFLASCAGMIFYAGQ